jgi:hypothetical protein
MTQYSFVCLRMARTRFLFSIGARPDYVQTDCHTLYTLSSGHPETTSRAVKWTVRGANYSPSSDLDVKNFWNVISTFPVCFPTGCTEKILQLFITV